MHINEKKQEILKIAKTIESLLTVFFSVMIIYGFDHPCIGGITIICALIHECGHLIVCFKGEEKSFPVGRMFGLGIRAKKFRGYGETVLL